MTHRKRPRDLNQWGHIHSGFLFWNPRELAPFEIASGPFRPITGQYRGPRRRRAGMTLSFPDLAYGDYHRDDR